MDAMEELQRKLQEQIEALAKQRQEEAARFSREVEEKRLLDEAERADRLRKYREQEAAHAARRQREQEEAEARRREEAAARAKLDAEINAAAEARRKTEQKLAWLEQEIQNQMFFEEQHRKSVALRNAGVRTLEEPSSINVEHPEAPLNVEDPGGPVHGTGGLTPETPDMSGHLKQILRQATR